MKKHLLIVKCKREFFGEDKNKKKQSYILINNNILVGIHFFRYIKSIVYLFSSMYRDLS